MKKVKSIIISILALLPITTLATDLIISNVRPAERGDLPTPKSVIFDLKWDNAWKNDKNYDAAWVFVKFGGYWDNHAKLAPTGHRILNNRNNSVPIRIEVSKDSIGVMIYPTAPCRGTVNAKIQLILDTTSQNINYQKLQGVSVHGIEMVYIPQGAFSLGSPDEEGIKRAAMYESNAQGERAGNFSISSENEIPVGPNKGELYYWSESKEYNGDQVGPIPSEFPKGFDAFYIMKYELTQGQYAAFLNTIPVNWTYIRSPIGGREYYKKRGGIRFDGAKYVADSPSRPMNYVSFTDGLAFSDWAGLRPLTELEYEKAARGPGIPIPYEFVWGTDNYDQLERYVDANAELILSNGVNESDLNDNNRPIFGASYYWVMDLSGSVWEKVITIGNSIGRSFKGSHGDGKLDDYGNATNEDWPKSDDDEGGFGYRGGGYYAVGTYYSDFNPHSPIGYRYYGAWSGGPRYISYGYRAARSAAQ